MKETQTIKTLKHQVKSHVMGSVASPFKPCDGTRGCLVVSIKPEYTLIVQAKFYAFSYEREHSKWKSRIALKYLNQNMNRLLLIITTFYTVVQMIRCRLYMGEYQYIPEQTQISWNSTRTSHGIWFKYFSSFPAKFPLSETTLKCALI